MKFVISALTDVAEPLRSEYEERDGKFYLKTEGDYQPLVDANKKVVEFRDNNRALNTTKTELENKLKSFEGVDPVEYKKLASKITELEKKGVGKADDVTELVRTSVLNAIKPFEERETARAASEKAAVERADRESLKSALSAAGLKSGIDERAMPDYISRGMGVFKVIEGEVVARKGEAPVFSKSNPAEVLTVDEWAKELQTEAPHLFKPSKGGGAGGNGASGGVVAKRTISSDPLEFGKNLEGIAKGEVTVSQ